MCRKSTATAVTGNAAAMGNMNITTNTIMSTITNMTIPTITSIQSIPTTTIMIMTMTMPTERGRVWCFWSVPVCLSWDWC